MTAAVNRRIIYTAITVSIVAAGVVGARLLNMRRPDYGLPLRVRFTPGAEENWTAFGGTWKAVNGSMRNDSNERGAKLLIGSEKWEDYTLEGNVQLLGQGDAGLVSRVSEAEIGVDSYRGYYAGVRTRDNTLVLGTVSDAYYGERSVPMPDPVRPFRWYHVRLKMEGCRIEASAWAAGTHASRTILAESEDCIRSGGVGLRSYSSGGVWRNIAILPKGSSPTVENEPNEQLPAPDEVAFQRSLLTAAVSRDPGDKTSAGTADSRVRPVSSLRYLSPGGSSLVTIRGSIVLNSPVIYVQDATGGAVIHPSGPSPLQIGDEVEATGEVNLDNFCPTIQNAQIRLLREASPVPPLVITVDQAAKGDYSGMFVQLDGYLRNVSSGKDDVLNLDFDAGAQSFRAILNAGRNRSRLERLAKGSLLRLRGICVVDTQFTKAVTPFVLIVRSVKDLDVVLGPPWWSPSTLLKASLTMIGLLFLVHYLFLQAKHWRLRAVMEERARLAHEIHDTLAQSFAGICFQLQAIRNSTPPHTPRLERQVDLAMDLARLSHEEARRSIASLRPESLGSTGLLPALRDVAERMLKNGNVRVEASIEGGNHTIPLRIKDTLFRIGQEAIANSIRHGNPSAIRIRLKHQRSSICLVVEDDGAGFVSGGDSGGFGLRGMRKRAESISATLRISSTPGSGTQVEVKAPMRSRIYAALWLKRVLPT
jgi:signal transduction histidine kinase